MNMPDRKVVVSVGPIPARVDSVKFLTNRFKGGLALRTANYLAEKGHDVTVVAWEHSDDVKLAVQRSPVKSSPVQHLVLVKDVFEYFDWFVAHAKDYDAFVMAAAVANLTPVHPYEGKFPSHNYQPGDEFDVRFMIAPRAIDAIKPLNPRACLVGYKLFDCETDEELAEIASHALKDSNANLIFANRPSDARTRKLALTQDGAVVPCSFDQHLELIDRAIRQEYYRTEIRPMSEEQAADPDVREALATAAMFEKTFPGHGTVAVPVRGMKGAFATTSRGHRDGPVIVWDVDHRNLTVTATGKATLNAPALFDMLDGEENSIIVHRHEDDPLYRKNSEYDRIPAVSMDRYLFPGTKEESATVHHMAHDMGYRTIHLPNHGFLKSLWIRPADWNRYYETFPDRYFRTPAWMQEIIDANLEGETLELCCNKYTPAKYAYDAFVQAQGAINLTWDGVLAREFDFAFIRNGINYLTRDDIAAVLERTDRFVANTFLKAPDEKVTDREAAVRADGEVRHALLLPGDAIARHRFYAYDRTDYEALGLEVRTYGKNSAILVKGV